MLIPLHATTTLSKSLPLSDSFPQGFDLITQFQLDVIPLKGVRKVDGSTSLQVAYRLDKEANFQIPTM